jgi:NAD(P)-dependent dehydrogenase (short-subunit alcohol dehydrogenase family)
VSTCIAGGGALAAALAQALPGARRVEVPGGELPASIDALWIVPPAPWRAPLARFEGYRADFERGVYAALAAVKAALPRLAPRARLTMVAPPDGGAESAAAPLRAALASLVEVVRAEHGVRASLRVADADDGRAAAALLERAHDALRAGRLARLVPGPADRRAGLAPAHRRRARYRAQAPRSALVTGASSGLGLELSRRLAPRLERLVLLARRAEALDALRRELEAESHCRIETVPIDLRDPAAVDRFASGLEPIDLLVQCAGVHRIQSVADTPLETYRELLETNFLAPARLASAALVEPNPSRQVAHVISTSAIAGRRDRSAYAMSKAALWALTRELRRAHGARTQVLEVLPSTFDSRDAVIGEAAPPRSDPGRLRRARTLRAADVAARVDAALGAGLDRLYVPSEVRAYLWLEALAPPPLFRRLFP